MKRFLLFSIICFVSISSFSQNVIGGDIAYKYISIDYYEITVTLLTIDSITGKNFVAFDYGDNYKDTVFSYDSIKYSTHITQRNYVTTHTYPGFGYYYLIAIADNWISGIQNIENSINESFKLACIIKIGISSLTNSSPTISSFVYDTAFKSKPFKASFFKSDPDNDSISYQLTNCFVDKYLFPNSSITFELDSITGELLWNSPTSSGIFAIGIETIEWRGGIMIGSTIIQSLVLVIETDNINSMSHSNELIKLYPNPTKGKVFCKKNQNENEVYAFEVYNDKGLKVNSGNLKNNYELINLQNFSSGIYFIKFSCLNSYQTSKIVLK